MQAIAIHRYAKSSAQKARLVADQIRGLPVEQATNLLTFSKRKAAGLIKKVLLSAVADEGPSMKRMFARAKGRGDRIVKRSSHITVVVSDDK